MHEYDGLESVIDVNALPPLLLPYDLRPVSFSATVLLNAASLYFLKHEVPIILCSHGNRSVERALLTNSML